MVKGIKLKEKSKRKQNESGSRPLLARYKLRIRIRATLARILIPGPGKDPRLRIRVRLLALKHGLFWTFYGLFRTRLVPEKICSGVCVEGGTASIKIGVKTRKIVGSASLLLDCAQVFYTSRGGGLEAPIRRMARWGLQVNRHRTSFIKIDFNPCVCFAITFSHSCMGRRT